MPWKRITAQAVRATIDGNEVEAIADRWNPETRAVMVTVPYGSGGETKRVVVPERAYVAQDEKAFQDACGAAGVPQATRRRGR